MLSLQASRYAPMAVRSARVWEAAPLDPSWIIDGAPMASLSHIASDGVVSTGYWRCTEGRFTYHYAVDETITLIDGLALIQGFYCGPGSTLHFERGSTAEWHVFEPVTKMYVIEAKRSILNRIARKLRGIFYG